MKNNAEISLPWTLGDIADYEYLLYCDLDGDEDYLHKRDRHIFLEWSGKAKKSQTFEDADKASLFRFWLENRRWKMVNAEKSLLPGPSVTRAMVGLQTLVTLLGLLSGFGLVKNLLHYEGNLPSNVSYYFLLVILLQLFLLILIVLTPVIMRTLAVGQLYQNLSLVVGILRPVFNWLSEKAYFSRLKLIPEEKRLKMMGWKDEMATRIPLYNQATRWKLASVIQRFGIAFNLAAIITFSVTIGFSDRAFGWQSTIDVADDTVYHICRNLALPWGWFVGEGTGYPSLEQIEGTRVIRSMGSAHLAAGNLHSWWPFLILATTFYGFLPRLLLALWIRRKIKTVFSILSFNDYESDKLYRRLTTHIVVETPEEEEVKSEDVTGGQNSLRTSPEQRRDIRESCILLTIDLDGELDKQSLIKKLTKHTGREIQECLVFGQSAAHDRQLEETLKNKQIAYLAIIDQDWNAPTGQDLERIQKFISAAGDQSLLTILLTGLPEHGSPTNADPEHLKVWKRQIAKLHHPRIGVETLVKYFH
ncbi:MAG: DUF2868 domain-containing protein [Thermodesulfobacteriota bacterium]|nr:DUF2868 domain-containing protein [Thermodesulfobacteriota bacterium]